MNYSVIELKQMLKARGLPVTGLKKCLVQRLQQGYCCEPQRSYDRNTTVCCNRPISVTINVTISLEKEYVSPEQVRQFVKDLREFKNWVHEFVPESQRNLQGIKFFVDNSFLLVENFWLKNCIDFLSMEETEIRRRFSNHMADMFIMQKKLFYL